MTSMVILYGNTDNTVSPFPVAFDQASDAIHAAETISKNCNGGQIIHPEYIEVRTGNELHYWRYNTRLMCLIHHHVA